MRAFGSSVLCFLCMAIAVSVTPASGMPCHPYYRWVGCEMDDIIHPLETHTICDDPECTIRCDGSTVVHYCEQPVCEVICLEDICELGGCPRCNVVCEESVCKPDSDLCQVICEPANCVWDYESPDEDDAPKKGCRLDVHPPSCVHMEDSSETGDGSNGCTVRPFLF